MFPLSDDNPTLRIAFVNFGIIALNVASWIWLQGLGTDPHLSGSVCDLGLVPGELLGTAPEGTRVALTPSRDCVVGDANWITPLTSMFLHGGWFHIVGNMWFLWVFGDNVEDAMGRVRYVFFFVLCGLAAAGTQMWVHPSSAIPMVGASGAIGGVMGAYAILYPGARVNTLFFFGFFFRVFPIPAVVMLIYWFALQVLSGLPMLRGEGAGVAFWAHVGGFTAGSLLVFAFRDSRLLSQQRVLARAHRRARA